MWGYIFAGMLVGALIGAFVMGLAAQASKIEAKDAAFKLGRDLGFGEGMKRAQSEQRAKHRDRGLKAAETKKANRASEPFAGQGVA